MSIYFIADTHFSSEALIRYENRPFKDARAMDLALIDRWNSIISDEDIIYHLGDFGAEGREADILKQLKGHIRLVKGNHDTASNDYYRSIGFEECYDLPVILDSFWILSHEPLYINIHMPYANIFGHVHASPLYRDFSSHHCCVSLERTNYAPISFDVIKKAIAEQT